MALDETIAEITTLLFNSPLGNKPEDKNATTKVFMATLSDIDDVLLKAAVTKYLTAPGNKWFPSIAEIREAAVSLVNRADDVPDSYTAWMQIKRHMRGGPVPHALALRAINLLGGIREYGNSDIDDESSWRARFIACYEQLQRRQSEDAMMLPAVAGYIEERRQLNGQSVGGMLAALTGKLAAGKE